jgi:Xaa-Pro aminopeptidase
MKEDIDALMAARDLDALVVSGKALGNPPLLYLLNGAHVTQGLLVKKQGARPHLIVSPLEREEARASGYEVVLSTRYGYGDLLREHDGDALQASVAYQRRIFADLGISGRVGVYGYNDQGEAFTYLTALDAVTPDVEIVGEYGTNLLTEARATKDADEVARIREVGRRTVEIVRRTVRFLQGHAVDGDGLLRRADDDGALTIADVHRHIHRLIAAQGLEAPEDFIFSIGRDAGIPHSRGTPDDPIRLGVSIIFDIFPREAGGGYFFDLTRTFCLGYAPEPVAHLHRDVLACLQHLHAELAVGEPTRSYQQRACAYFEAQGHPTVGQDATTLNGYVHGLGHGLGLDLHEAPSFQDTPANALRLQPGHTFTLEPGLYYPERGMGCRLEDVVWIDAVGAMHNLTTYPYDLVVPMGTGGG